MLAEPRPRAFEHAARLVIACDAEPLQVAPGRLPITSHFQKVTPQCLPLRVGERECVRLEIRDLLVEHPKFGLPLLEVGLLVRQRSVPPS